VIAVVHLVWGPLGPTPLRSFVRSYRTHDAGTDHRLVVLFNGVTGAQRPALVAELEGVEHELLELAEPVQDLAAYAQAAARLKGARVCLLNSYSEILAPGWLGKLASALERPGVGLVGATGSWASLRSLAFNLLFLPNPYRGALPPRRAFFEQFGELERDLEESTASAPGAAGAQPKLSALAARWQMLRSTWEQVSGFEGFPAVHVRTNAFMADAELLAALIPQSVSAKMDAYRLESGRWSLTSQVGRLGLRPLVVDRAGAAHEHEHWPASRTFWQGDQEGLLVADKQTEAYACGALERRRVLSTLAWGPRAQASSPRGGIG
jgi:hypothetical protein